MISTGWGWEIFRFSQKLAHLSPSAHSRKIMLTWNYGGNRGGPAVAVPAQGYVQSTCLQVGNRVSEPVQEKTFNLPV